LPITERGISKNSPWNSTGLVVQIVFSTCTALEGRFATEFLAQSDCPVECDPRHHLGVREVPPSASHLPDPFVGLAPAPFEQPELVAAELPGRRQTGQPVLERLIHRVGHFADDVELRLVGGCVADAYGPRVVEARQPVELPLRESPLARDAVHDLRHVRVAGHRPQEPSPPLISDASDTSRARVERPACPEKIRGPDRR
jgi:hypothetical protein